jgi:hypothetical protein
MGTCMRNVRWNKMGNVRCSMAANTHTHTLDRTYAAPYAGQRAIKNPLGMTHQRAKKNPGGLILRGSGGLLVCCDQGLDVELVARGRAAL